MHNLFPRAIWPTPRVRRMNLHAARHGRTYHGYYIVHRPSESYGHVVGTNLLKTFFLLLLRLPAAIRYNAMGAADRKALVERSRQALRQRQIDNANA